MTKYFQWTKIKMGSVTLLLCKIQCLMYTSFSLLKRYLHLLKLTAHFSVFLILTHYKPKDEQVLKWSHASYINNQNKITHNF